MNIKMCMFALVCLSAACGSPVPDPIGQTAQAGTVRIVPEPAVEIPLQGEPLRELVGDLRAQPVEDQVVLHWGMVSGGGTRPEPDPIPEWTFLGADFQPYTPLSLSVGAQPGRFSWQPADVGAFQLEPQARERSRGYSMSATKLATVLLDAERGTSSVIELDVGETVPGMVVTRWTVDASRSILTLNGFAPNFAEWFRNEVSLGDRWSSTGEYFAERLMIYCVCGDLGHACGGEDPWEADDPERGIFRRSPADWPSGQGYPRALGLRRERFRRVVLTRLPDTQRWSCANVPDTTAF